MTTCASYGSSSEVALYYALDPDLSDLDLTDNTIKWQQIRMTGETMDLALSSTISDEITPQRSYANSKLTQGNVSGGFNFEASAEFLDNWLIAALQADKDMTILGDTAPADPWDLDAEAITNGSRKHCLTLLKVVTLASGNYDLYVFRGCQVGSLDLSFQPGALITGSVSIMGTGGQAYANQAVIPAGWTLTPDYNNPLMSGVDSLTGLQLQSSVGADLGIIFQNFSLKLDNQIREQFGVGTGSIYAAGVASGRFMLTMDAAAYYSNPAIFNNFVQDNELKVVFSMLDSTANGWDFLIDKVKVTGGSTPQAGGPDQDLIISSTFQGFESATNGTVKITKQVV